MTIPTLWYYKPELAANKKATPKLVVATEELLKYGTRDHALRFYIYYSHSYPKPKLSFTSLGKMPTKKY